MTVECVHTSSGSVKKPNLVTLKLRSSARAFIEKDYRKTGGTSMSHLPRRRKLYPGETFTVRSTCSLAQLQDAWPGADQWFDGVMSRKATSGDQGQMRAAREAVRVLRRAGFLLTYLELGFNPD
jgi:hypothetical protein